MQAIILAAGQGSRLRPLTQEIPKCLVEVGGKSILARTLEALMENGVHDVVFTTGYREEKIRAFVAATYPALRPLYIKNDRYQETNYIYSLWLARAHIIEDVIFAFGDWIYEKTLIKKAVDAPYTGILVSHQFKPPQKDFKARLENGFVKEIANNIDEAHAIGCVSLYKVLLADWQKWMACVDDFIREGKTTSQAEDALNTILHTHMMRPIFFENEGAIEIDDLNDFKRAEYLVTHLT
ncbi:MAG: phosphocholine cytidylyltransferase family protein [Patescibacteria group bacterium]